MAGIGLKPAVNKYQQQVPFIIFKIGFPIGPQIMTKKLFENEP